jgi:hypothetical protein
LVVAIGQLSTVCPVHNYCQIALIGKVRLSFLNREGYQAEPQEFRVRPSIHTIANGQYIAGAVQIASVSFE